MSNDWLRQVDGIEPAFLDDLRDEALDRREGNEFSGGTGGPNNPYSLVNR